MSKELFFLIKKILVGFILITLLLFHMTMAHVNTQQKNKTATFRK